MRSIIPDLSQGFLTSRLSLGGQILGDRLIETVTELLSTSDSEDKNTIIAGFYEDYTKIFVALVESPINLNQEKLDNLFNLLKSFETPPNLPPDQIPIDGLEIPENADKEIRITFNEEIEPTEPTNKTPASPLPSPDTKNLKQPGKKPIK